MAQNFKNLEVYKEAYSLSLDIAKELETMDKKNFRLQGQLFGPTTSICAQLAEMGFMDNKKQQAEKVRSSIGEANKTEFWLDFCKDSGQLDATKHKDYVNRLKAVRMKLFNLRRSILKEAKTNVFEVTK